MLYFPWPIGHFWVVLSRYANKSNFHMRLKTFTLGLTFAVRFKATRTWPISSWIAYCLPPPPSLPLPLLPLTGSAWYNQFSLTLQDILHSLWYVHVEMYTPSVKLIAVTTRENFPSQITNLLVCACLWLSHNSAAAIRWEVVPNWNYGSSPQPSTSAGAWLHSSLKVLIFPFLDQLFGKGMQ